MCSTPYGLNSDTCIDFSPNLQLEGKRYVDFLSLEFQQRDNEPFSNPFDLEPDGELWEPDAASYYAGELILQPQGRWTREEKLELLHTHPIFTGKCLACKQQFSRDDRPPVHWDCPCGWIDDTV